MKPGGVFVLNFGSVCLMGCVFFFLFKLKSHGLNSTQASFVQKRSKLPYKLLLLS